MAAPVIQFWRKHNTATTINFALRDRGTQDFENTPVTFATGDAQGSLDEGNFGNLTNPVHEGNGAYSMALTAGALNGARLVITIIDSATKTWEDQIIVVETYGNASAQHAMDFDDAVRGGLTALPDANADAGGGLPISDAGGLDMDARLDAAVSSRATPAQVNTEVLDVLNTDTFAESGGVVAATASLVAKVGWLCTLARNRITQTASTQTLRNDADNADIATAAVSDDGTTAERSEWT